MSKKRIKGLCMMLIGLAYMFSLFVFIDTFEKMNETLCFILTIISVLLILFGLIFILTKSHEELLTEEKIKREEHIKLSKYYKYKPYLIYFRVMMQCLTLPYLKSILRFTEFLLRCLSMVVKHICFLTCLLYLFAVVNLNP